MISTRRNCICSFLVNVCVSMFYTVLKFFGSLNVFLKSRKLGDNMHEEIEISTEYIALGQFIKLANVLESGGMVKAFLQDEGVLVNNEREHRRGRKLYAGDIVELEGIGSYKVIKA
jgi:ribosome-associated protein